MINGRDKFGGLHTNLRANASKASEVRLMKKIIALGLMVSLCAPAGFAADAAPDAAQSASQPAAQIETPAAEVPAQTETSAQDAAPAAEQTAEQPAQQEPAVDDDALTIEKAREILKREAEGGQMFQAQIEENVIATENLDIPEYSPSDVVHIYESKYVITKGSVIKVSFAEKFASRKHKKGDVITFINQDAIVTTNGTQLLPAQTPFYATVIDVKKTRKLNHNAQLMIQFDKVNFLNQELPVVARPFYAGYALKEGASKNWARGARVTAIAAGAGALAGAGFGSVAAGAAVGTGIGLVYSVAGPGVNFVAAEGEEISIILIDDLTIPKPKF